MNYFHGSISAKTAERRLLTHKDNNEGLYLLRESQGSYIISYVETKHKNVGHILVPNSINSNGEPKTNFLKNNPQLQSVQDILEFMATRCFGRIKMLCPLSKDEFRFDNDAATDFEDDGVTCNICDLKVRNLKSHVRSHNVHHCQRCDKIILQSSQVSHKLQCNPKKNCDGVFTSTKKLENHRAAAHGGPIFKCPRECGKMFPRRSTLNRHLSFHCGKNKESKSASTDSKHDGTLEMWEQVTDLRWEEVTSGKAEVDDVKGGTLKQMYEDETRNISDSIEFSEQSLCSDRDPRVVTFEEIVRMSSDGGWDDVTLICADGRFKSNGFLLAAMFPVIRSMFSDVLMDDVFISLPDVRVANLKMLFHSIQQKNSIIRVGDGLSHLLSSNLQYLEIKTHEVDDHKDHDYIDCLGNGSEDEGGKLDNTDLVRISIRKKSNDEIEEIMNKIKKERQCRGDTEKNLLRICVMCGKRVKRKKYSFEKHKRFIEDQDGFKCIRCSRNKVPCELCGKMFSLLAMRRHIKLQMCLKFPKKYQCLGECGNSECRNKFKYPKDLRRHQEKKEPQTCHICGYIAKSKKAMYGHLISHDSTRSKCPYCYRLILNDSFEGHKKECEKIMMSVCNICDKTFKNPSQLQSHNKKWHEVHEPKHKCDKCGETFIFIHELKRHKVSHEDKTPCPECGVKVRRLKLHMMQAHTPDDQKRFQCPDCGKGFLDKRTLGHHRMNVHLKLRPYNCRYGCDIAYNDTSNRNQHEKKIHGKLYTTEKEKKAKFFNAVT